MQENNYWAKIHSLNIILNNYFSKGNPDRISITIIESFADFSSLNDAIVKEDLKTINQPLISKILEIKAKCEYKKLLDMAKHNTQLTDIIPMLKMALLYRDSRNKEMAKIILEVVANNQGKRILVQTGINHKYYLLNELSFLQNEKKFTLMEYWEK